MAYRTLERHERVRTTITLPSDLLERSQRFIDDGTAPNRTVLIETALEHLLNELERGEIDRQFAVLADDESYADMNKAMAEEFAESDWEALDLSEAGK